MDKERQGRITTDDRGKTEERYCLYCDMINQPDEGCRLTLECDSIPHNYGTETMYQVESQITYIVGKNPGITVVEIAVLLTKTPSVCSQLVRKLRKKDWTEQIRNSENSWGYQLFLTESGWKTYEGHDRLEQACYKRSFNNLKEFSGEGLKKYISIQKKLNETFTIDVKESKNT